MEKNTVMFSGKAISKAPRFHFLVDTALRMKLITYLLLPETTVGINEKVTEKITDQNVSNATPLPLLPEELDELKALFYSLGESEIDLN